MMNMRVKPEGFKIGDLVRCTGGAPNGEEGIIRLHEGPSYLVEFDTWREGHDGGIGLPGNGWWLLASEMVHAKPEPKFKVGDRVRGVGCFSFDPSVGTIVSVPHDSGFVVQLDRDGTRWCYLTEQLEPVVTPNHAIVARLDNGEPRPSLRPYVHTDVASATKEAERLAAKEPCKEFGVYELVTTRKADKVYAHEWQRLAAQGLDESAASELAKLSGLAWDVAHSAVFAFRRAA